MCTSPPISSIVIRMESTIVWKACEVKAGDDCNRDNGQPGAGSEDAASTPDRTIAG